MTLPSGPSARRERSTVATPLPGAGGDPTAAPPKAPSPVARPVARLSAPGGGPSSRPSSAVEALLLSSTEVVPGVGHVSINLLERGGAVRHLAATGEVVRRLDELQFALNQGPSVDALHGDEPIVGMSARCPADLDRWPRVVPEATASGLLTVLAIRMAWEQKTLGVMTVGSDSEACLPRETVLLATAFAAHAAATVGLARKAEQLELAMVTRQEIGQAVGILMERYGMTADSAFAYLRRLSQNMNVKLRDIADQLRLTGRLPGDDVVAGAGVSQTDGAASPDRDDDQSAEPA